MASSTTVGEINITLNINNSSAAFNQVKANLDSTSKKLNSGAAKMEAKWTAFTTTISNLATSAFNSVKNTISSSVGDAIKRADTLNQFPKVMGMFGVSADEASAALDRATEHIKGLPTTVDAAAESIQGLYLTSGDLGLAEDMFYAINDAAVTLTTDSSSAIDSFIYGYKQALSAGTINAEDFGQMNEAIPGLMAKIAEKMGKSEQDMKDGLSDGSISIDEFNDAFKALDTEGSGSMSALSEAAHASTAGIQTTLDNAHTAIVRNLADVLDAIGTDNINTIVQSITEDITKVIEAAKKAVEWVKQNVDPKFLSDLTDNAKALLLALLGYKTAKKTLQTVGGAFVSLKNKIISVKDKFSELTNKFSKKKLKAPKVDTAEMITSADSGAETVKKTFSEKLGTLNTNISSIFETVKTTITGALGVIKDVLVSAIQTIMEPVKELFKGVGEALAGFFKALAGPEVISGALSFAAVAASVAAAILLIGGAIGIVTPGLTEFLNSVVIPLVDYVVSTVLTVIDTVITELTRLLNEVFIPLGTFIADTFLGIVNGLADAITNLAQNAIMPLINVITGSFISILNTVKDVIIQLTRGALIPLINTLSGSFISILNAVSGVLRTVGDVISNVVGGALRGISGVIDSCGRAFEHMGNAISGSLNAVRGVLSEFASIITAISSALVAIVSLATHQSVQYGAGYAYVSGAAKGGLITGDGTSTSDSIPMMLSNGEYVIRAAAAKKFGYRNLDQINEAGSLSESGFYSGLLRDTTSFDETGGSSKRPITVNMTNEINNEMDAEDIGRVLMQSIRRAA